MSPSVISNVILLSLLTWKTLLISRLQVIKMIFYNLFSQIPTAHYYFFSMHYKEKSFIESYILCFSFSLTCCFHPHYVFQENKINFILSIHRQIITGGGGGRK